MDARIEEERPREAAWAKPMGPVADRCSGGAIALALVSELT